MNDLPVPDYPFPRGTALEPPAEWAELRSRCPVAGVRLPSGDTAGLVTGYDDVRSLLTDPRFRRGGGARVSTTDDGGIFSRTRSGGMAGDGHQRWRRLLTPFFTMKKMEAWRPRVQAMMDALVDDMVASGSPADLSARVALPLPVQVICALVGAPAEDHVRFAHWSQVMLTLTKYSQDEVERAYEEFGAYVSGLVDRARTDPGDDLLSELTQISDGPDGRLGHEELIGTVRGLLLAGHETTSNMITIMTAMLLSEPSRYAAVVSDPSLIRGTVEEVLRLDSTLSVIGFPRVALPLPVQVICALVGAPAEDHVRFAHWSQVMLTLTKYTQAEVEQAYEEFGAYVSGLVDRARSNPGDDLLSELTQISDGQDGRLGHEDLIGTVRGLLLAGHETTSNMITIMTAMLLSEPARYAAVVEDPELIRGTVEEVLRLDSTLSVIGFPRVAAEDAEVAGTPVPAGSTLIPCRPAANRDPRRFEDPDRFDPHRPNAAQHLTFGAGPHYCLGQPLARLELQVALGTLTRRLPNLALHDGAEALRLRTGLISGGLQNVRVTW